MQTPRWISFAAVGDAFHQQFDLKIELAGYYTAYTIAASSFEAPMKLTRIYNDLREEY